MFKICSNPLVVLLASGVVSRMSRWFLSYHSPDHVLAQRFKTAIEQRDRTGGVFFAPQHNRAGGFWTAQLAQEIAEAEAFILLVGEHGIGPWQVLEYYEALDKRVKSANFPVIMVLLEGQSAPGLAFLRRLHWIAMVVQLCISFGAADTSELYRPA
jgi:hypothetical protein